jgi:hypothetical protein
MCFGPSTWVDCYLDRTAYINGLRSGSVGTLDEQHAKLNSTDCVSSILYGQCDGYNHMAQFYAFFFFLISYRDAYMKSYLDLGNFIGKRDKE